MASSRQKSCGECSKAKRRCDLKIPCLRCTQRRLTCIYANAPQLPTPPTGDSQTPSTSNDFPQESSMVQADFDFPIDPSFDMELGHVSYNSNISDMANGDLNSLMWQNDPIQQVLDPSLESHSNKLRIDEILRTGADYRRGDYHKTDTVWDSFTYESFSDPNSRFSCSMAAIKECHREFAVTCGTSWLHPRLYKNGMPENMLAAFTDCVLFANKNKENEALVYRSMERNVESLLLPEFVAGIEEHLARLQALLLYQSIHLFTSDTRQKTLAEARMGLFEKWTDLLGDLRDASPYLSNLNTEAPDAWESWIQAESIRRTIMACYCLVTLYYMLKQEPHNRGAIMRSHPWTLSRHLWEAPSSFDFFCAWREKPRFHMSCLNLDDFLAKGKGDDVDAFGRNIIVTYIGLDETKQWFRDRGSVY